MQILQSKLGAAFPRHEREALRCGFTTPCILLFGGALRPTKEGAVATGHHRFGLDHGRASGLSGDVEALDGSRDLSRRSSSDLYGSKDLAPGEAKR
jgi:hypothetical protein